MTNASAVTFTQTATSQGGHEHTRTRVRHTDSVAEERQVFALKVCAVDAERAAIAGSLNAEWTDAKHALGEPLYLWIGPDGRMATSRNGFRLGRVVRFPSRSAS